MQILWNIREKSFISTIASGGLSSLNGIKAPLFCTPIFRNYKYETFCNRVFSKGAFEVFENLKIRCHQKCSFFKHECCGVRALFMLVFFCLVSFSLASCSHRLDKNGICWEIISINLPILTDVFCQWGFILTLGVIFKFNIRLLFFSKKMS